MLNVVLFHGRIAWIICESQCKDIVFNHIFLQDKHDRKVGNCLLKLEVRFESLHVWIHTV